MSLNRLSDRLYRIRMLMRVIRWRARHLHLLLLVLVVTVTLWAFSNLSVGLVPYLTLGVEYRTAGVFLTIEGVLLGLSPLVREGTSRALAVTTATISLIISTTTTLFLDLYQTQNASPFTFINLGPFRLTLANLFATDILLFVITIDFYAVGAIMSREPRRRRR